MTAQQYNRLNELLAEYSRIDAALEAAEAEIKKVQLDAASELLPEHAQLKVTLTDLETALRKLSEEHYVELFAANDSRTHKTPFGGVKFHKSSSIECDDDEMALLKVEVACAKEAERARLANEQPRFVLSQLVRTHQELNLEALAGFDDATLVLFGVRREASENFKVLPFDMRTDKPKKVNGKVTAAQAQRN